MTRSRLRRATTASLLLAGALAIAGALGLGVAAHHDRGIDELEDELTIDSAHRLDGLDSYFGQWARIARLLATDPTVVSSARGLDFVNDPNAELTEVALLSGAFPGEVTRPRLVPMDRVAELTDQPAGAVHHSAPHELKGFRTWVITTSAVVGVTQPTALLQFSVPVEDYRTHMTSGRGFEALVIDARTGQIIMDGRVAVAESRQRGEQAHTEHAGAEHVIPEMGGQHIRAAGGDLMSVHRSSWNATDADNANDWMVVVSHPAPTGLGLQLDGRSAALLILGVVVAFAGIAWSLLRQRDLRRVAETDELTGLGNRRAFRDQGQRAIDRAENCHVVLLDLDRFKQVNDTFGHEVGDDLICQVAQRVQSVLPRGSVLARTGGDEFAAVVEVGEPRLESILAALTQELGSPFLLAHGPVITGASVGVASLPGDAADISDALRKADIAMFRAKGTRAKVLRYDADMDPDNPRRVALHQALVTALPSGDVRAHFQPKIDMRTRRIGGFEALARWTHEELGPISPGEFIPIAEDRGLMPALTTAMLGQSVAFLSDVGSSDVTVSVNISPVLLQREEFVEEIAVLLHEHGVRPGRLVLELTEDLLVGDSHDELAALERLRQLGCKVSIDDFGTGHSSLSYLARLPADELKIDRAFVQDMETDASKAFILQTTIDLGRRLGLEVVAEGVETTQMWDMLRDLDCDVVQGWLVAPAMPAGMAERWYRQQGGVWAPEGTVDLQQVD